MFANASDAPVDRVYFNAYFVSSHATTGVRTDTNVEGGHVFSPTGNAAVAWLGFWRDCNGDGYIGLHSSPMAYGSQTTYAVASSAAAGFPVNASTCPAGGDYWLTNPSTGQPNAFVDEFRWIGPDAGCDDHEWLCPGRDSHPPADVCVLFTSPRIVCVESMPPTDPAQGSFTVPMTDGMNDVTDAGARVWGDWERPGGPHVEYGPFLPAPRGTFADSDGTLRYVDGILLRSVSSTVPGWSAKPNVGACDQPNPTFLGGSGNTCGAWPLYQVRRLVNDSSCGGAHTPGGQQDPGCWEPDPLVTTWDIESDDDTDGNPCNDFFDEQVDDPRNDQVIVRVQLPDPAVGPGSVNPNFLADGSIAGTLEHQERGVLNGTDVFQEPEDQGTQCGPDQNDPVTTRSCGVRQLGCGFLETDSGGPSTEKHAEVSMAFNFTTDRRLHHLQQFGIYDFPLYEGANVVGGPSGADRRGAWSSDDVWIARPPRTGWGYTTDAWATFYADVTAASVSAVAAAAALPAGAQDAHTYGTEFCSAFTTGPANVNPVNDWECSRTQWEAVRATYPRGDAKHHAAIIGDKYDLRDVDCYDNTVSSRNRVVGDALDGVRAGVTICRAS